MENKTLPKVSVIMPVYNGNAYIQSAINSLLAQTLQDWELIVIDDGSSDATPQILRQFTDSRIKVFRQENSGEAQARNVGLTHAAGEYVAFLDADDFYFPKAMEDLSFFLDQHPEYGVVYSNGQICDSADNPIMTLSEIRPGIYTGNILEYVVLSSSVVTVPVCTMTRRSEICKHSVQFDRNLVIGPDWDFWIQLAVHVEFGYLDRLTCKYRVHTNNITRTVDLKKRRRDQAYRQMKILNSDWFGRLSLHVRELVFLDLLTNALTGDVEGQRQILESERFAGISTSKRADLWRLVGIDVLKNSRSSGQARSYFSKSLSFNGSDWKTRLLLGSLAFGSSVALMFIKIWYLLLRFRKGISSSGNSQTERLQKILGVR